MAQAVPLHCLAESCIHTAPVDAHADSPQALVGPQHWWLPEQPVPHHAGAGLRHADQPALLSTQAGQAVTGAHPLVALLYAFTVVLIASNDPGT